jgi:putative restriction endonuclease
MSMLEPRTFRGLQVVDYKTRVLIEKAARDAAFEINVGSDENEFRFRSSLVPSELLIGTLAGGYRVSVQDSAIRNELIANFVSTRVGYTIGDGYIAADGTLALQLLAERIFQLSMSLPTRPLDVFRERIKQKPDITEVERLVRQRVGQDVFREALERYWQGRCPVTGISDRALLRASHIRPWAMCDGDDQRLDVYNGILLTAHVDAAFDAATFDPNGKPLLSELLSQEARDMLIRVLGDRSLPLTDRHQAYLDHHRARFKSR